MSDDNPTNGQIDKLIVAISELIQAMRAQNGRIDRIEQQTEHNGQQIAGLIELAKSHSELIEGNTKQIAELREQGKEQDERINALIKIVEGHLTNHP